MNVPAVNGIIRRRILLNYRIAPELIEPLLPGKFRPKLVGEYAIAGICLIRLEQIRPKGLPAMIGISSENSAHRIAVLWNDGDESKEGVFVPRRDTDSRLNAIAGGRIFPGVHYLSKFKIFDVNGKISLRIDANDYETPLIDLTASETKSFPSDSVFSSLEESSQFFEAGYIGYSSRPDSSTLDRLLLKVTDWHVSPLKVESLHSAYFKDESIFPSGKIHFDHALLMRDISPECSS